jgi:hypothetical protein
MYGTIILVALEIMAYYSECMPIALPTANTEEHVKNTHQVPRVE